MYFKVKLYDSIIPQGSIIGLSVKRISIPVPTLVYRKTELINHVTFVDSAKYLGKNGCLAARIRLAWGRLGGSRS